MNTMERIAEAGVVAVLRAPDADTAVQTGLALARGGVWAIEVTFSTPDAPAAISALRRAESSLLVGAGTVLTCDQLHQAHAAGAQFVMSPHTDVALAAEADAAGLVYVPGALTPTEVVAAARVSPLVKLFPASLGGPSYLRAVREPLPQVQLIPTGGVSVDNLAAWQQAGAYAVGAGGGLCAPALMAAGDYDQITERARAFAEARDNLREAHR